MRREDKQKYGKVRDRRRGREEQVQQEQEHIPREKLITSLEPRTEPQAHYISSIGQNVLTIATGPAGTGKTYCCGVLAGLALKDHAIGKIVFTRPAVTADEDMGFLPGDLEEKFDPYVEPFREVLIDVLGLSTYEYMVKAGHIVGKPLGFMRGHTFKNAFVILDEAQNTTPAQMKLFLTRVGHNCTVVVNGDVNQSDIKGPNGLSDAVKRLKRTRRVGMVQFEREDIVRSGFVQDIVDAYDR